jgi:hypothetical protein
MLEQDSSLAHRADILNGLKSLCLARPDWYECLRAVAVQNGVAAEFDKNTQPVIFIERPTRLEGGEL